MAEQITCGDCKHIVSRKSCALKQIAVARKAVHDCELFVEKVKPQAVYVPSNYKERAKKTRSFLRKLQAIGGEIGEDGTIRLGKDLRINADGSVSQRTSFEIPRTTAHASVVGLEGMQGPQLSDARDPKPLDE